MIEGIKCNVCGAHMPERIIRQIPIQLPPLATTGGRVRKVIVQVLASGSEFEMEMVQQNDPSGKKIGMVPMERLVVDPKDYDICMECQVKFLTKALALMEKQLDEYYESRGKS